MLRTRTSHSRTSATKASLGTEEVVILAVGSFLSGDATRDDSQKRLLGTQCWNNIVTARYNIATMLQCCDTLKIVVANRPIVERWPSAEARLCQAKKNKKRKKVENVGFTK